MKKPAGSVRFWFYKSKTEKTEPSQIGKKPSQTEPKRAQTKPNRFEPIFVLKNLTETSRFEPVLVFFLKFRFGYFFLIKTEPNRTENDHLYSLGMFPLDPNICIIESLSLKFNYLQKQIYGS